MKIVSIFFFSGVLSELQLSFINKISNSLGNHNARRRQLIIPRDEPRMTPEDELFQQIISFDNSYRKHIENFKKSKSVAFPPKPDTRQTMRSYYMKHLRY